MVFFYNARLDDMALSSLFAFLLIVALASFLQALTGFALGIFALGGVIAFNVSSLETAALVINIMMVTNVILALGYTWREVNCKLMLITVAGVLPGALLGLWLLHNLGDKYFVMLQVFLGFVIVLAGVTMCIRPKLKKEVSQIYEFGFMGILGGIFGGLYSIPGPPVVYLFYQQPLAVSAVRSTLLAIFGIMSVFRLVVLGTQGEVTEEVINLSLLSVPVVIAVSAISAWYPLSISDVLIRRGSFILLTCMGFFISATALS